MATITLRETKGSPLSFAEVDGNFTNLNDSKQELINSLNTDSTMTSNADYVAYWDSGAGSSRKILGIDTPFFYRTIIIKALPDSDDTYVGDGITAITIPDTFDGLYLYSIGGHVYTAGTGSTTDIQLYNLTTAVDVLSTKLTIDAGETDSSTASTAVVINSSGSINRVYTATVLRVDIDQIGSSTAAKGLEIRMQFRGSSS